MAALILRDVDAASDIVVETIAAVCRQRNFDPRHARTRVRLAASVYSRCVGVLVARERFGVELGRVDVAPDTPLARLPVHQRCAIALILFGGHDLFRAARTLNRPVGSVLRDLVAIADSTEAMASTVDHRVAVLPRQRAASE